MHISPETNPINPVRLSAASSEPVTSKSGAEAVSFAKEADHFRQGLLAELTHELKKLPDIRQDVVDTAARDIDSIDLKEFGSRLAAELNSFESTDSK
jgi:hypothetical protein